MNDRNINAMAGAGLVSLATGGARCGLTVSPTCTGR
jgi:hypothetical protein